MDLFDLRKLAPFLAADEYARCWTGGRKSRGGNLRQAEADGVVARS